MKSRICSVVPNMPQLCLPGLKTRLDVVQELHVEVRELQQASEDVVITR